jgi:hypothetical protein
MLHNIIGTEYVDIGGEALSAHGPARGKLARFSQSDVAIRVVVSLEEPTFDEEQDDWVDEVTLVEAPCGGEAVIAHALRAFGTGIADQLSIVVLGRPLSGASS